MSLKGNIKSFELTTIFQLLQTEKKTGLLQLQGKEKTVSVFIKKGNIAYAADGQADTRLGYLLRSSNVITDEQLERCFKLCDEKKQDLIRILLDEALITKEKLQGFVQKQTENIVFDLFFWEEGDFEYKDVGLNPDHMLLIQLNTMQILLEGSRRVDEMHVLKKRIPSDDLVFRKEEEKQVAANDLDAHELPVFSLINGRHTIRQLIDKSGYDEYSIYRILNSLIDSGFIEQGEDNETQRPVAEAEEERESLNSKMPPDEPGSLEPQFSSPENFGLVKSDGAYVPAATSSYNTRFYRSLVGKQLDNYGTIKFIGSGSMGGVFQGWDVALEREVALKVISFELSSQGNFRDMFIEEARMISELEYPNIAQIYYAGTSNDILYYAMEFINGDTLAEMIRKYLKLNPVKGVDYLIAVCKALDFVNKKNIIHRDIKPENIMVNNEGVVKIVGFGVGKINEAATSGRQQAAIISSPLYMSPEFPAGRPLDYRSDIYSLGASFYHAFTGYPPFDGDSVQDVLSRHLNSPLTPLKEKNPEIPNVLGKIIEKMMAKDPQDRYQDYQGVITSLEAIRPRACNQIKKPLK